MRTVVINSVETTKIFRLRFISCRHLEL